MMSTDTDKPRPGGSQHRTGGKARAGHLSRRRRRHLENRRKERRRREADRRYALRLICG
jgi:hypothetical protein